MKWDSGRRSDNVEDRRGASPARIGLAGGGIGLVAVVLLAAYFGIDPSVILQSGVMTPTETPQPAGPVDPAQEELSQFVSVVLADTEDTWHALFEAGGQRYEEPKLVLFSGAVQSACGNARAAMGPFYCPGDRKVYIDLSFYRDLRERHQAPGDFAQAYVIAHEIGHHVQNLLGIADQVQAQRERMGKVEANQLSVRMELQADCLAGIWANHANRTRQILESGDIEEALNAATSIGDDRLQQEAQGYVVPEGFTHGTSAQRVRWFTTGVEAGQIEACDTFNTARL
jgi:uncharacterized protein